MITFTLSLFLALYGLILLFVLFMAVMSTYHLVRFGATSKISFGVTFAFFAGSVLILFFTAMALRGTDWNQEITIGSGFGAMNQQIPTL